MIKKNAYYLFSGTLFVWCLISCAAPRSSPPVAGEPSPPSPDALLLTRKTDEILQMLSTRQYDGLTGMIEPDEISPAAAQIARCLLAPKDASILLYHWNAGDIQVHFQNSPLHAHSTIPVAYKTHPNRKPLRGILTFYFYRRTASGPWFLLPCPDAIPSAP